jgi:hypothetical protein
VYGKERKKNRKVKKKMCMREWKRVIEKREKKERRVARKIWEGWIKWKKKNKVQGAMSRCWETKLSFFFQPCAIRQQGYHRCLVAIFFFCPCTCTPFYIFSSLISPHMVYSHDHWLWKVNNH